MSNTYYSGSLPSHFKPHQQGPRELPTSAFGKTTLPALLITQDRPDHVLINQTGSYYFLTSTTASLGGTTDAETYVKTAVAPTTSYLPIKLEFNPVAWSGSAAEAGTGTVLISGDVSFIYKGGL